VSELKSSREELAVARELLDLGCSRQAVSRAYYAAFYAARDALESIGETPKTHAGTRARFSSLAHSSPYLDDEIASVLSRLETRRGRADYGDDVPVSAEQAEQAVADARVVVEAVERWFACKPNEPQDAQQPDQ
jgi:uncharacterized protein (UPF0332 family)